jgi:hypothetical protein
MLRDRISAMRGDAESVEGRLECRQDARIGGLLPPLQERGLAIRRIFRTNELTPNRRIQAAERLPIETI